MIFFAEYREVNYMLILCYFYCH